MGHPQVSIAADGAQRVPPSGGQGRRWERRRGGGVHAGVRVLRRPQSNRCDGRWSKARQTGRATLLTIMHMEASPMRAGTAWVHVRVLPCGHTLHGCMG